MAESGTVHGLVMWWQLDMLPRSLQQQQGQQPQQQQQQQLQGQQPKQEQQGGQQQQGQQDGPLLTSTMWLSTAPSYAGSDPGVCVCVLLVMCWLASTSGLVEARVRS